MVKVLVQFGDRGQTSEISPGAQNGPELQHRAQFLNQEKCAFFERDGMELESQAPTQLQERDSGRQLEISKGAG